MSSKLPPCHDLSFLLYERLNVGPLTYAPRCTDCSRETLDAAPNACERIATDLFAPYNKKNDQGEPHSDGKRIHIIPEVKVTLDAFNKAGLMTVGQNSGHGGMQPPIVAEKAGFGLFKATNVDTNSYPFLTIGNVNLLFARDMPTQIETFVQPEMEGRFYGMMCLSESQTGLSSSDIVMRAEYEGESPLGVQYRLTGNKIWISAGEHKLSESIVHLVLAKIPGLDGRLTPGVRGISLFIMPKFLINADGSLGEHSDMALVDLNHKMDYRGTANCLLSLGEGMQLRPKGADGQPRTGVIGCLAGEPHKGLAYMFHMMNKTRVGAGMGATMLGCTDYLHTVDYARNRPQGRPVGSPDKDAVSSQIRVVDYVDVRRMLLAQKAYVEGVLGLNLHCVKFIDEERGETDIAKRARSDLLLGILTSIAKSWPSQWCLEVNSLAIQVHDDYGYTREYNVEQFYRDSRLNSTHEGTHGTQSPDLLGYKVVMQDGVAFIALDEHVQTAVNRALETDDEMLVGYGRMLGMATQKPAKVTQTLWAAGSSRVTLASVPVYLEASDHVAAARAWLEQALAAVKASPNTQGKDANFYHGKLQATRCFFQQELLKTDPQIVLLGSLDTTILDVQDARF